MTTNTRPAVSKTTPGTLVYPWLNKADTKFNAEGLYHTKIRLPAEVALPLVNELTNIRDERANALTKQTGKRAKLAQLPWEISEDGQTVEFKFKLNATGVNRSTNQPFEQKPVIYGPDGKVTEALVTNGSTALVAYEPVIFANAAIGVGLTLRLKAVKVLEFAAMAASASSVFGDDDYGYSAQSPVSASGGATGGSTGGASGDYDF